MVFVVLMLLQKQFWYLYGIFESVFKNVITITLFVFNIEKYFKVHSKT